MTQTLTIAIDGTSGSGKSTLARGLAKTFGLRYLNTGAMYRAVTLSVLQAKINPADEQAAAAHCRSLRFDFDGSALMLNGEKLGDQIRQAAVDEAVSIIAKNSDVRAMLVCRQKEFAAGGGIVIEGRDIGSVVAPRADVKFYVTADNAERAQRRAQQLSGLGMASDSASAQRNLASRDKIDSTRKDSPLAMRKDAVLIDTSDTTIEQTLEKASSIVRRVTGSNR